MNKKRYILILVILSLIFIIYAIFYIKSTFVVSEDEYYIYKYLLCPFTEYIANSINQNDKQFKDIDKWKTEYNFEADDFYDFYKTIYDIPEVYIHSSQRRIKVLIIAKNEEYRKKGLLGIYSIEYDICTNKIIYYNKGY